MTAHEGQGEINISRIPVEGFGGLGLVIMSAVVVYNVPALRSAGLIALIGGVVIGLALLISRHRNVRRTAVVLMVLLAVSLLGALVVQAVG